MSGPSTDPLLDLALARFGSLNDAERKIVAAVAAGGEAHFDDEPTVSARLIAWLIAHQETADLIGDSGVFVYGAEVDDDLDLSGARLHHRLGLVDCRLGDVYLDDARTRTIMLDGSSLGALHGQRSEIVGSLSLRRSAEPDPRAAVVRAGVWFGDAAIHGYVDFDGAQLGVDRDDEDADEVVAFDGARIEGSLFLWRTRCAGTVNLAHTLVRGQLSLLGAKLVGEPERPAFDGRRLSAITLSMTRQFEAAGLVLLHGATIGVLEVNGARFQVGLHLRSATISDLLLWADVTLDEDAELDWTSVSARMLEFDLRAWPEDGEVALRGLTYGGLLRWRTAEEKRRGVSHDDIAGFLDVIRLQTLRGDGYSPQPYEQLAAALRASGQEREAQQVLIARGDDAARRRSRLPRFVSWMFKVTVGYGYRPLQVIWWLLGVFLVSAVVFRLAYEAGDFGATGRVHPPFSSLAFSLDSLLPFIDLGQERAWTVKTAGISPASVYYWCHVCVGWLLSSFVVAGVARTAR